MKYESSQFEEPAQGNLSGLCFGLIGESQQTQILSIK